MSEVLEIFGSWGAWTSLATLTALEIVLGIDNLVFITILSGRLPESERHRARRIGLAAALVMRILLLGSLSFLMSAKDPLFHLFNHDFSLHDLILIGGGLFLLAKSTIEIYHKVEHPTDTGVGPAATAKRVTYRSLIIQIMLIDMVFFLYFVITVVGMVDHLSIMVIAVLIATGVMIIFSSTVGDFIERNPSFKILALSFLVVIGVLLLAEGFGEHLSRGYVYFGMAFSLCVELLNLRYDAHRNRAKKTLPT